MKTREETLEILKSLGFSSFNLNRANLRGADLRGADLSRANLNRANLSGANLSRANLNRANLSGATLMGANLRRANLRGADLAEIRGKIIGTFQFNRHFAYYCDGNIRIGCQFMAIKDWLEKYEWVGKLNGYTDLEIEFYGNWITMINKEFGGTDEI